MAGCLPAPVLTYCSDRSPVASTGDVSFIDVAQSVGVGGKVGIEIKETAIVLASIQSVNTPLNIAGKLHSYIGLYSP
jgi:hypothetical protein